MTRTCCYYAAIYAISLTRGAFPWSRNRAISIYPALLSCSSKFWSQEFRRNLSHCTRTAVCQVCLVSFYRRADPACIMARHVQYSFMQQNHKSGRNAGLYQSGRLFVLPSIRHFNQVSKPEFGPQREAIHGYFRVNVVLNMIADIIRLGVNRSC